jgi:hypothetical protein
LSLLAVMTPGIDPSLASSAIEGIMTDEGDPGRPPEHATGIRVRRAARIVRHDPNVIGLREDHSLAGPRRKVAVRHLPAEQPATDLVWHQHPHWIRIRMLQRDTNRVDRVAAAFWPEWAVPRQVTHRCPATDDGHCYWTQSWSSRMSIEGWNWTLPTRSETRWHSPTPAASDRVIDALGLPECRPALRATSAYRNVGALRASG